MSKTEKHSRPRGHPAKTEVNKFRTMAWFHGVSACLGKNSGYAFRKHFSRNKFDSSNGSNKRTRRFYNYKSGRNRPNKELIDQVDEECPGTKSIIFHPFWDVLESPCQDIQSIYPLLQKLRPEIRQIIFHKTRGGQTAYQRRNDGYLVPFEKLNKEGDMDALIACLGLIHEMKYYGEDDWAILYTRPTLNVFIRAISNHPYFYLAEELSEYLNKNFLNNQDFDEEYAIRISSKVFPSLVRLSLMRLIFIDEFNLLRHYSRAPTSCLHTAESYLSENLIYKIKMMADKGNAKDITKLPEVKKLSRALKRWEEKNMPATAQ